MSLPLTRRLLFAAVIAIIGAGTVLTYLAATRQVDKTVTMQDESAILAILQQAGQNPLDLLAERKPDFNAQVSAIRAVQQAVLLASPNGAKIPPRQSREPADLLRLQQGQCNDRARTMDKALRFLGFESRYASVFDAADGAWPITAIMRNSRNVGKSHVVLEVKTDKGWMVVDTVPAFVGVSALNKPVDLREMQQAAATKTPLHWQDDMPAPYKLLQNRFVIVYGLYGRHGLFYPPYDRFPDINWDEFALNWQ